MYVQVDVGKLVMDDKYRAIMSRFKEVCDVVSPESRPIVEN
jgi:hypothetical protein